jgi:lipopolysaccharide heptosyltransferase II
MSVPAVRAIKAGRPDAHVTVAAPEKIASVWKLASEVDQVVSLPNKSLIGTVKRLRQQPRFDLAITFPNSIRSALELWLSGIGRRVGYRGHYRSALLNQIVREPKKPRPLVHQAERYVRIAVDCGADVSDARFSPAPNSSIKSHTSFLALCPGAEYGPAKRWLADRFIEVARTIADQHGVKWILFGARKDVAVGQAIASALGQNALNRTGETTLDELIEQLRDCRLLLTNDTGTMHLGALLGVPVVAVFGSTEPGLTGPLGDGHIVIRRHVECSPCFLRECPIDFRCMNAVTSTEVIDAVNLILKRTAPP